MKNFKFQLLLLALVTFSFYSCEKESATIENPTEQALDDSVESKVPDGSKWLDQQENQGGHTLERHWQKSDAWLINRMCNNNRLPVASSFKARGNKVTKNIVGNRLKKAFNFYKNDGQFRDIRNGQNKRFSFNTNTDWGICIGRRNRNSCNNRGRRANWNYVYNPKEIVMIVRKTRDGKRFFMLTAYPQR